ncbi:MAG: hypothetical protein HC796_08930 [Synechococcaceae cyanobacterium RL_1_2]|nr:hypothetical protein [Synechococcaceae cyanobacterium RL_1_2]
MEGFEVGINIEQRLMTYTLEHVFVKDQRRVGIAVDQKPTTMRDIISRQSLPKVSGLTITNQGTNRKEALVVVVDSEFTNSAGGGTAILNESFLFARNIKTKGYSNSLISKGQVMTDRNIDEFTSDRVYRLWEDGPRKSLNLEIRNVPHVPFDPNFEHWAVVDLDAITPQKQAAAVQTAIDDGYSTIYLQCQQTRYEPNQTVVIRNKVERIHGGWCNVRPTDNLIQSSNPIWQLETTSADVLMFEAFHTANPPGTKAWWWQNNSTKTVILADVEIPVRLHQPYKNGPGAGDLFIEQVFNHTDDGMTYKPDGWWVFDHQNVWARNLDAEFNAPPRHQSRGANYGC